MNFQIPVEHMFSLRLEGLNEHSHEYAGPFGHRRLEKSTGGTVNGAAMEGRVLELLATDYGRASPDGSIRAFNASFTLQSRDGTVILMQYRGRASPRYGAGEARIQALFQAPEGPFGWFNGIQAIGYGREHGGATIFEIYALTGEAGAEGDDDTRAAAQRRAVPGEFIFRRKSEHTPGAKRHEITAPLGSRYFTLAEGGGKIMGPKVSGDYLSGFSWSPHRMKRDGDQLLMQYDVDTLLRADDGSPILMSYTGVTSGRYPKGTWMTAALFETTAGAHDWLNEVQAIGYGRWAGDGAEYSVYALR